MNNDADQKPKWRESVIDGLKKLDGVAAVNLAEPSPGDLERINNAYHDALAEIDKLRAENAELKKQLEKANAFSDKALESYYKTAVKYSDIVDELVNLKEKLSASTAQMENLAEALEQYSAGDLTPVATETLKKYRESK